MEQNLDTARLPAYPGEEATISLEEASRRCGIEPKRFLGHAMNMGMDRPIGDGRWFYVSSVDKLAARLKALNADRLTFDSSVAP